MPPKKTAASKHAPSRASSHAQPKKNEPLKETVTNNKGKRKAAETSDDEPSTKKSKPSKDAETPAPEPKTKTASVVSKAKAAPKKAVKEVTPAKEIAPEKKPAAAKKSAVDEGKFSMYESMKKDGLVALCKARGLVVSGNKSDLTERLEENDPYEDLKVDELKAICKDRGLGVAGKKSELQEGLRVFDVESVINGVVVSKGEKAEKKTATAKKVAAPKVKPAGDEYENLKNDQLKALCKERGLRVAGSKAELQERLRERDANPVARKVLNTPPTTKLEVFVCGEGEAGELGLGSMRYQGKMPMSVKRPRVNHLLDPNTVGIVQMDTGGQHCAALTYDNKILTWGVNDAGALGRDTSAGDKFVGLDDSNSDASDDDDDDDSGLNSIEVTPTAIDTAKYFPEGTIFAAVSCSDSATFVLTDDGLVYGWGTFRGNNGEIGFQANAVYPDGKMFQATPVLIKEVSDVVSIKCGTNHVLALTSKGQIWTWGAGEQSQCGRRIIERDSADRDTSLTPYNMFWNPRAPKIKFIGCGDYTSYAIANDGKFYSWGLNSTAQTGHPLTSTLEGCVVDLKPVKGFENYMFTQIQGGAQHTIALGGNGEVYVWGGARAGQLGMPLEEVPEEFRGTDENGVVGYLIKPVHIKTVYDAEGEDLDDGDLVGARICCGPDTNMVVSTDGKAYAWGESQNYNTGLGTQEPVIKATEIDNSAVRGKNLVYCGLGGQFGVLGAAPLK